jgi:glutathione synthase
MKLCFLIHHKTPMSQAENARLLSEAARELGHEVALAPMDELAVQNGKIMAGGELQGFDLVWVLSLGSRETFLDKIQLLKLLEQKTRVVNSPDALLYMHSKICLSELPVAQYPETYISADAEMLWDISQAKDGKWVIKPVAESFGEGVELLTSHKQLKARKGYCLLQRYVPEIKQGEKRVLVAGGEVVGHYIRKGKGDFRTNLHQGAQAATCDLTEEEKTACRAIARYLLLEGAVFAGIDLCWPYVLEWNVISPGGIATLARLTGQNIAKTVVNRVLASSQKALNSLYL